VTSVVNSFRFFHNSFKMNGLYTSKCCVQASILSPSGSWVPFFRLCPQIHTVNQVVVGAILRSIFSILWSWSWMLLCYKQIFPPFSCLTLRILFDGKWGEDGLWLLHAYIWFFEDPHTNLSNKISLHEKLCWYLFPVLPAREETNWCSQDLIFCAVHISSGLYLKMIALDFNGHNGNNLMVVDMRQWNQVLEHHLWNMLRFWCEPRQE